MKFGLFFELSTPRPFTTEAQRMVFENAIEQTVLADELGFSSAWCVEHHFLEEYSHSSCPDMFLTALARETKKIRLGFGIGTCVPAMHSPIRWAEKAAFLDMLSNGRVDFGTGRSSTWNELGGFEANVDETKRTWDEFCRVIPKMWTEERFSHDGTYFSMPERCILPKPVQDPHPPLWVAVTAPGTELDAAERGMGAIILSIADVERVAPRIAEYRERIKTCTPVGSFVNDQVAIANWMFCHEDNEYATKKGHELVATFGYMAGQTVEISEAYPANNYTAIGLLGSLRPDPNAPGMDKKPPASGLCFGDPAQLTATIKRWEAAGVDQIIFMLQAREHLPQADVLASMRLFAEEVMPRFATGTTAPKAVAK
jgi:alkanesulfonate monooxygenase SsuD/methylene tetrahydromethanopterin reductase-like flavin-dependent oxidoreductase (luciferase family)